MKLCFIFYSLLSTLIHDALSESMPFNILSPVFGFVPGSKFPLNCTICILYCLKTKSLWRAQRDWPEKFSAIFFNLLPYSSSSQSSSSTWISREHVHHLYLYISSFIVVVVEEKNWHTCESFHKWMGYKHRNFGRKWLQMRSLQGGSSQ